MLLTISDDTTQTIVQHDLKSTKKKATIEYQYESEINDVLFSEYPIRYTRMIALPKVLKRNRRTCHEMAQYRYTNEKGETETVLFVQL